MNRYQADNKDAMANAAPLFASSWLALFQFLRENYQERYTTVELDVVDLDVPAALINEDIAEPAQED